MAPHGWCINAYDGVAVSQAEVALRIARRRCAVHQPHQPKLYEKDSLSETERLNKVNKLLGIRQA